MLRRKRLFLLLSCVICSVFAAQPPSPGTVLDQSNVSSYAEFIDETLVQLIGEGKFTLEVTASESFPIHPAFAVATEAHRGTASLPNEPGILLNYVSGRPFPEPPSLDDPRAGDKLACNLRYTYAGDASKVEPFFWQYRNMKTGKIERELSFAAMTLRFKHRIVMQPVPDLPNNQSQIFNGLYLRVLDPSDIRNTQVLIHRLEDDTRQEEGWLYLGTQRRVRRLPTGQNTDAFLGSDIMIEDFLGYNGRIMDMEWRYLGTRDVLLPFYRHDDLELSDRTSGTDNFHFVEFFGQGNCFPKIKWQYRTAYLIEAVPKWNQHPLSKRLYYIDAETFVPAYGRLYDNSGKLWKFAVAAYSHPDNHLASNKGSHVPVLDAVTMIDLQAQHCTTLQARTEINTSTNKASDFAVQALRTKGR
ncbi:MAG: hypothetical protein ACI915_002568 [Gammaproteobacteria bacterium]|jgi:hypothetical protein